MPLSQRIAIVAGLWLLAGIACAILTDVTVDAGESEAMARLQIVLLFPIVAAAGFAITIVQDQDHSLQQRILCFQALWWIAMAGFSAHAVIAITRRNRRQFMALIAVEIVILVTSVSCVLFMWK